MRTCVIKIMPDNEANRADIQTGGVTALEILDFMNTIMPHFAQEVIKDYQEITGVEHVDPNKLGEYMSFLRANNL